MWLELSLPPPHTSNPNPSVRALVPGLGCGTGCGRAEPSDPLTEKLIGARGTADFFPIEPLQKPLMNSLSSLTETQRMIYNKTRIADTLYNLNRDKFSGLSPSEIHTVSIDGDNIIAKVEDISFSLKRLSVIGNFWSHRTRTPSYFEYKVCNKMKEKNSLLIPIGKLDYSGEQEKVYIDKHGEQSIYFVDKSTNTCTCESFAQLNKNRDELENEWNTYLNKPFIPMCKHLQWHVANTRLELHRFNLSEKNKKSCYNPRICIYHFDYAKGRLLYRVTNDGLQDKMKWYPSYGWKEKDVFDSNHLPTGNCWNVLIKALTHEQPYQIIRYSNSVARVMSHVS